MFGRILLRGYHFIHGRACHLPRNWLAFQDRQCQRSSWPSHRIACHIQANKLAILRQLDSRSQIVFQSVQKWATRYSVLLGLIVLPTIDTLWWRGRFVQHQICLTIDLETDNGGFTLIPSSMCLLSNPPPAEEPSLFVSDRRGGEILGRRIMSISCQTIASCPLRVQVVVHRSILSEFHSRSESLFLASLFWHDAMARADNRYPGGNS